MVLAYKLSYQNQVKENSIVIKWANLNVTSTFIPGNKQVSTEIKISDKTSVEISVSP